VNHSVVLNWTPSSSSNISGYDVYRGTTAGGPYALLTSSPVSSSSFTDSTAQGGQTYYYVVTSVSGSTQSAYSNVVSVTIP
jgi:fibronectin type 3 domain-containing protein